MEKIVYASSRQKGKMTYAASVYEVHNDVEKLVNYKSGFDTRAKARHYAYKMAERLAHINNVPFEPKKG